MYPKRGPKLETGVPKEIEEEYIEAAKCFDAGAYKASVAMCRRAIQASVVAKGAKGNRLVDQINNLHDLGIITKDICDWAHEISDFGTHRYN